MYFYTNDIAEVQYLANVLTIAAAQGQAVRIDVDSEGRLKIKRGGGMWSPSLDSGHDPVRDLEQVMVEADYCKRCGAWDGSHFTHCDY